MDAPATEAGVVPKQRVVTCSVQQKLMHKIAGKDISSSRNQNAADQQPTSVLASSIRTQASRLKSDARSKAKSLENMSRLLDREPLDLFTPSPIDNQGENQRGKPQEDSIVTKTYEFIRGQDRNDGGATMSQTNNRETRITGYNFSLGMYTCVTVESSPLVPGSEVEGGVSHLQQQPRPLEGHQAAPALTAAMLSVINASAAQSNCQSSDAESLSVVANKSVSNSGIQTTLQSDQGSSKVSRHYQAALPCFFTRRESLKFVPYPPKDWVGVFSSSVNTKRERILASQGKNSELSRARLSEYGLNIRKQTKSFDPSVLVQFVSSRAATFRAKLVSDYKRYREYIRTLPEGVATIIDEGVRSYVQLAEETHSAMLEVSHIVKDPSHPAFFAMDLVCPFSTIHKRQDTLHNPIQERDILPIAVNSARGVEDNSGEEMTVSLHQVDGKLSLRQWRNYPELQQFAPSVITELELVESSGKRSARPFLTFSNSSDHCLLSKSRNQSNVNLNINSAWPTKAGRKYSSSVVDGAGQGSVFLSQQADVEMNEYNSHQNNTLNFMSARGNKSALIGGTAKNTSSLRRDLCGFSPRVAQGNYDSAPECLYVREGEGWDHIGRAALALERGTLPICNSYKNPIIIQLLRKLSTAMDSVVLDPVQIAHEHEKRIRPFLKDQKRREKQQREKVSQLEADLVEDDEFENYYRDLLKQDNGNGGGYDKDFDKDDPTSPNNYMARLLYELRAEVPMLYERPTELVVATQNLMKDIVVKQFKDQYTAIAGVMGEVNDAVNLQYSSNVVDVSRRHMSEKTSEYISSLTAGLATQNGGSRKMKGARGEVEANGRTRGKQTRERQADEMGDTSGVAAQPNTVPVAPNMNKQEQEQMRRTGVPSFDQSIVAIQNDLLPEYERFCRGFNLYCGARIRSKLISKLSDWYYILSVLNPSASEFLDSGTKPDSISMSLSSSVTDRLGFVRQCDVREQRDRNTRDLSPFNQIGISNTDKKPGFKMIDTAQLNKFLVGQKPTILIDEKPKTSGFLSGTVSINQFISYISDLIFPVFKLSMNKRKVFLKPSVSEGLGFINDMIKSIDTIFENVEGVNISTKKDMDKTIIILPTNKNAPFSFTDILSECGKNYTSAKRQYENIVGRLEKIFSEIKDKLQTLVKELPGNELMNIKFRTKSKIIPGNPPPPSTDLSNIPFSRFKEVLNTSNDAQQIIKSLPSIGWISVFTVSFVDFKRSALKSLATRHARLSEVLRMLFVDIVLEVEQHLSATKAIVEKIPDNPDEHEHIISVAKKTLESMGQWEALLGQLIIAEDLISGMRIRLSDAKQGVFFAVKGMPKVIRASARKVIANADIIRERFRRELDQIVHSIGNFAAEIMPVTQNAASLTASDLFFGNSNAFTKISDYRASRFNINTPTSSATRGRASGTGNSTEQGSRKPGQTPDATGSTSMRGFGMNRNDIGANNGSKPPTAGGDNTDVSCEGSTPHMHNISERSSTGMSQNEPDSGRIHERQHSVLAKKEGDEETGEVRYLGNITQPKLKKTRFTRYILSQIGLGEEELNKWEEIGDVTGKKGQEVAQLKSILGSTSKAMDMLEKWAQALGQQFEVPIENDPRKLLSEVEPMADVLLSLTNLVNGYKDMTQNTIGEIDIQKIHDLLDGSYKALQDAMAQLPENHPNRSIVEHLGKQLSSITPDVELIELMKSKYFEKEGTKYIQQYGVTTTDLMDTCTMDVLNSDIGNKIKNMSHKMTIHKKESEIVEMIKETLDGIYVLKINSDRIGDLNDNNSLIDGNIISRNVTNSLYTVLYKVRSWILKYHRIGVVYNLLEFAENMIEQASIVALLFRRASKQISLLLEASTYYENNNIISNGLKNILFQYRKILSGTTGSISIFGMSRENNIREKLISLNRNVDAVNRFIFTHNHEEFYDVFNPWMAMMPSMLSITSDVLCSKHVPFYGPAIIIPYVSVEQTDIEQSSGESSEGTHGKQQNTAGGESQAYNINININSNGSISSRRNQSNNALLGTAAGPGNAKYISVFGGNRGFGSSAFRMPILWRLFQDNKVQGSKKKDIISPSLRGHPEAFVKDEVLLSLVERFFAPSIPPRVLAKQPDIVFQNTCEAVLVLGKMMNSVFNYSFGSSNKLHSAIEDLSLNILRSIKYINENFTMLNVEAVVDFPYQLLLYGLRFQGSKAINLPKLLSKLEVFLSTNAYFYTSFRESVKANRKTKSLGLPNMGVKISGTHTHQSKHFGGSGKAVGSSSASSGSGAGGGGGGGTGNGANTAGQGSAGMKYGKGPEEDREEAKYSNSFFNLVCLRSRVIELIEYDDEMRYFVFDENKDGEFTFNYDIEENIQYLKILFTIKGGATSIDISSQYLGGAKDCESIVFPKALREKIESIIFLSMNNEPVKIQTYFQGINSEKYAYPMIQYISRLLNRSIYIVSPYSNMLDHDYIATSVKTPIRKQTFRRLKAGKCCAFCNSGNEYMNYNEDNLVSRIVHLILGGFIILFIDLDFFSFSFIAKLNTILENYNASRHNSDREILLNKFVSPAEQLGANNATDILRGRRSFSNLRYRKGAIILLEEKKLIMRNDRYVPAFTEVGHRSNEKYFLSSSQFHCFVLPGARLRLGYYKPSKEYLEVDDWMDLFETDERWYPASASQAIGTKEMMMSQPSKKLLRLEEEKDFYIFLYHKLLSALNCKYANTHKTDIHKLIYRKYLEILAKSLPLNIGLCIDNNINNTLYGSSEELDQQYLVNRVVGRPHFSVVRVVNFVIRSFINNIFPACFCEGECHCEFKMYKSKVIAFVRKTMGKEFTYKNSNSIFIKPENISSDISNNEAHACGGSSVASTPVSANSSRFSSLRSEAKDKEIELDNVLEYSTISYKYFTLVGQTTVRDIIKGLATFRTVVLDCFTFEGVRDVINNVCNIMDLNAIYINSFNSVHLYKKLSKFIEFVTHQKTVKSKTIKKGFQNTETEPRNGRLSRLNTAYENDDSDEESATKEFDNGEILFLDQDNYDEFGFLTTDEVYHGANSSKEVKTQLKEKDPNISPVCNSILIVDGTNVPTKNDMNFIPMLTSLLNQVEPYIQVKGGRYTVSLVKHIIFLRNSSINKIKVTTNTSPEKTYKRLDDVSKDLSMLYFFRFPHIQIFNCPVKADTIIDMTLNDAYLINKDKQRQLESMNLKKFISMGIKKLLFHHFGNLTNNSVRRDLSRSTGTHQGNQHCEDGKADQAQPDSTSWPDSARRERTDAQTLRCVCCNASKNEEIWDMTLINNTYFHNNNYVTHIITIIKLIISYIFIFAEQLGVCKMQIVNKQLDLCSGFDKLNVDINFHKNRVFRSSDKKSKTKGDASSTARGAGGKTPKDGARAESNPARPNSSVFGGMGREKQTVPLSPKSRLVMNSQPAASDHSLGVGGAQSKATTTFDKTLNLSTKIKPIQIVGACDYTRVIKVTKDLSAKRPQNKVLYEYLNLDVLPEPEVHYQQASIMGKHEVSLKSHSGSTSIVPIMDQSRLVYKILPEYFSRKLWVAAFYNVSVVLYHLHNYLTAQGNNLGSQPSDESMNSLLNFWNENNLLSYIFKPKVTGFYIPPPLSATYLNEIFYLDKTKYLGPASGGMSFINSPASNNGGRQNGYDSEIGSELVVKKLQMIEEEPTSNKSRTERIDKGRVIQSSNRLTGTPSKDIKNNVYYGIINVERYFDFGEVEGMEQMAQSYYLPKESNFSSTPLASLYTNMSDSRALRSRGFDTPIPEASLTSSCDVYQPTCKPGDDNSGGDQKGKIHFYYYLTQEKKMESPQKRLLIKEKMTPNLVCSISPFRHINKKRRRYLAKLERTAESPIRGYEERYDDIVNLGLTPQQRHETSSSEGQRQGISENDKKLLSSNSVHSLVLMIMGMMFSNSQFILFDDRSSRFSTVMSLADVYLGKSFFKIKYKDINNNEMNSTEMSQTTRIGNLTERSNRITPRNPPKHTPEVEPASPISLPAPLVVEDKPNDAGEKSPSSGSEDEICTVKHDIQYRANKRKFTVNIVRRNDGSQEIFSVGGKQNWSIHNDLLILVNKLWNFKEETAYNSHGHHWLNLLFAVRNGTACVFHLHVSHNEGSQITADTINTLPFPGLQLSYFDMGPAQEIQDLFEFADAKFRRDISSLSSISDTINKLSLYSGNNLGNNSFDGLHPELQQPTGTNQQDYFGMKQVAKKSMVNQLNLCNLMQQQLLRMSSPIYRMGKLILSVSLMVGDTSSTLRNKIEFGDDRKTEFLDFSKIKFYKINVDTVNRYLYAAESEGGTLEYTISQIYQDDERRQTASSSKTRMSITKEAMAHAASTPATAIGMRIMSKLPESLSAATSRINSRDLPTRRNTQWGPDMGAGKGLGSPVTARDTSGMGFADNQVGLQKNAINKWGIYFYHYNPYQVQEMNRLINKYSRNFMFFKQPLIYRITKPTLKYIVSHSIKKRMENSYLKEGDGKDNFYHYNSNNKMQEAVFFGAGGPLKGGMAQSNFKKKSGLGQTEEKGAEASRQTYKYNTTASFDPNMFSHDPRIGKYHTLPYKYNFSMATTRNKVMILFERSRKFKVRFIHYYGDNDNAEDREAYKYNNNIEEVAHLILFVKYSNINHLTSFVNDSTVNALILITEGNQISVNNDELTTENIQHNTGALNCYQTLMQEEQYGNDLMKIIRGTVIDGVRCNPLVRNDPHLLGPIHELLTNEYLYNIYTFYLGLVKACAFGEQMGRKSLAFKWFANMYVDVFVNHFSKVYRLREKYSKIIEITNDIKDKINSKEYLQEIVNKLERTKEDIANLITFIKAREETLNTMLTEIEKIKESINIEKENQKTAENIARTQLQQYVPALERAKKEIEGLSKQHIAEVRSMANPPKNVVLVIEAVNILLGESVDVDLSEDVLAFYESQEVTDDLVSHPAIEEVNINTKAEMERLKNCWVKVRTILANAGFLRKLTVVASDLRDDVLNRLLVYDLKYKTHLNPVSLEKVSIAGKSLATFIQATLLYSLSMKKSRPILNRIKTCGENIGELQKQMTKVENEYREHQVEIKTLHRNHQLMTDEMRELETNLQQRRKNLNSLITLLNNIEVIVNNNWGVVVKKCDYELSKMHSRVVDCIKVILTGHCEHEGYMIDEIPIGSKVDFYNDYKPTELHLGTSFSQGNRLCETDRGMCPASAKHETQSGFEDGNEASTQQAAPTTDTPMTTTTATRSNEGTRSRTPKTSGTNTGGGANTTTGNMMGMSLSSISTGAETDRQNASLVSAGSSNTISVISESDEATNSRYSGFYLVYNNGKMYPFNILYNVVAQEMPTKSPMPEAGIGSGISSLLLMRSHLVPVYDFTFKRSPWSKWGVGATVSLESSSFISSSISILKQNNLLIVNQVHSFCRCENTRFLIKLLKSKALGNPKSATVLHHEKKLIPISRSLHDTFIIIVLKRGETLYDLRKSWKSRFNTQSFVLSILCKPLLVTDNYLSLFVDFSTGRNCVPKIRDRRPSVSNMPSYGSQKQANPHSVLNSGAINNARQSDTIVGILSSIDVRLEKVSGLVDQRAELLNRLLEMLKTDNIDIEASTKTINDIISLNGKLNESADKIYLTNKALNKYNIIYAFISRIDFIMAYYARRTNIEELLLFDSERLKLALSSRRDILTCEFAFFYKNKDLDLLRFYLNVIDCYVKGLKNVVENNLMCFMTLRMLFEMDLYLGTVQLDSLINTTSGKSFVNVKKLLKQNKITTDEFELYNKHAENFIRMVVKGFDSGVDQAVKIDGVGEDSALENINIRTYFSEMFMVDFDKMYETNTHFIITSIQNVVNGNILDYLIYIYAKIKASDQMSRFPPELYNTTPLKLLAFSIYCAKNIPTSMLKARLSFVPTQEIRKLFLLFGIHTPNNMYNKAKSELGLTITNFGDVGMSNTPKTSKVSQQILQLTSTTDFNFNKNYSLAVELFTKLGTYEAKILDSLKITHFNKYIIEGQDIARGRILFDTSKPFVNSSKYRYHALLYETNNNELSLNRNIPSTIYNLVLSITNICLQAKRTNPLPIIVDIYDPTIDEMYESYFNRVNGIRSPDLPHTSGVGGDLPQANKDAQSNLRHAVGATRIGCDMENECYSSVVFSIRSVHLLNVKDLLLRIGRLILLRTLTSENSETSVTFFTIEILREDFVDNPALYSNIRELLMFLFYHGVKYTKIGAFSSFSETFEYALSRLTAIAYRFFPSCDEDTMRSHTSIRESMITTPLIISPKILLKFKIFLASLVSYPVFNGIVFLYAFILTGRRFAGQYLPSTDNLLELFFNSVLATQHLRIKFDTSNRNKMDASLSDITDSDSSFFSDTSSYSYAESTTSSSRKRQLGRGPAGKGMYEGANREEGKHTKIKIKGHDNKNISHNISAIIQTIGALCGEEAQTSGLFTALCLVNDFCRSGELSLLVDQLAASRIIDNSRHMLFEKLVVNTEETTEKILLRIRDLEQLINSYCLSSLETAGLAGRGHVGGKRGSDLAPIMAGPFCVGLSTWTTCGFGVELAGRKAEAVGDESSLAGEISDDLSERSGDKEKGQQGQHSSSAQPASPFGGCMLTCLEISERLCNAVSWASRRFSVEERSIQFLITGTLEPLLGTSKSSPRQPRKRDRLVSVSNIPVGDAGFCAIDEEGQRDIETVCVYTRCSFVTLGVRVALESAKTWARRDAAGGRLRRLALFDSMSPEICSGFLVMCNMEPQDPHHENNVYIGCENHPDTRLRIQTQESSAKLEQMLRLRGASVVLLNVDDDWKEYK